MILILSHEVSLCVFPSLIKSQESWAFSHIWAIILSCPLTSPHCLANSGFS